MNEITGNKSRLKRREKEHFSQPAVNLLSKSRQTLKKEICEKLDVIILRREQFYL